MKKAALTAIMMLVLALVPASQTSAVGRPEDTLADTCSCVAHH